MSKFISGVLETRGTSSINIQDSMQKSEMELQTNSVSVSIGVLRERIQVLQRRLDPVLTPAFDKVEGQTGVSVPCQTLSPIGHQLRQFSIEIDECAGAVQSLLSQLALD